MSPAKGRTAPDAVTCERTRGYRNGRCRTKGEAVLRIHRTKSAADQRGCRSRNVAAFVDGTTIDRARRIAHAAPDTRSRTPGVMNDHLVSGRTGRSSSCRCGIDIDPAGLKVDTGAAAQPVGRTPRGCPCRTDGRGVGRAAFLSASDRTTRPDAGLHRRLRRGRNPVRRHDAPTGYAAGTKVEQASPVAPWPAIRRAYRRA
jgi:hypothetical protein